MGHVYYISSGEGKLVGHERTCTSCGAFSYADPKDYAGISKSSGPMETLKRETYPGLDEALAPRMELEAKVKAAPHLLSEEERLGLVFSPINLISPTVEKHFATTHMDAGVALAIGGGVALCFLGATIGNSIAPEFGPQGVVAGLVIGAGLVIWQLIAAGPRFMRKEILPLLAKSLAPVQPSEAEVNRVLLELKKGAAQDRQQAQGLAADCSHSLAAIEVQVSSGGCQDYIKCHAPNARRFPAADPAGFRHRYPDAGVPQRPPAAA
ncbi:hypothetical protein [Massilia eburnea]|uniref:hypothetical protein n=1 Tax=Massilia eburnea TaxID=1776165 RepID=UPI0014789EB8|nr:hypothetical protein [Massilia eburnea]